MLPNTFIAGVQKSGTTTLRSLLMTHADIFVPERPKEIHYFDLDRNYEQGLEWLERHFEAWSGESIVLQSSPLYIYHPKVPERIAEVMDSPRFIFTLRHPAARAYSHYWHEVKRGRETLSFEQALVEEPKRLLQSPEDWRAFSYVDRGRYAEQLERFVERFGKQNVFVVLTEDLRRDPGEVRARCARFLGVDPDGYAISEAEERRLNAARMPRSYKLQQMTSALRPYVKPLVKAIDLFNLKEEKYPPMSETARAALDRMLRPEVGRLQDLGLVDVSHWGDQF